MCYHNHVYSMHGRRLVLILGTKEAYHDGASVQLNSRDSAVAMRQFVYNLSRFLYRNMAPEVVREFDNTLEDITTAWEIPGLASTLRK
jgi:hypothetical protein